MNKKLEGIPGDHAWGFIRKEHVTKFFGKSFIHANILEYKYGCTNCGIKISLPLYMYYTNKNNCWKSILNEDDPIPSCAEEIMIKALT